MRIIAVASGKGGVGKSTISYLLAKSLGMEERTLLLDFDVCGPSVGVLMDHTTEKVIMKEKGFKPIYKENMLYYLSISAMIPPESAVAWRAPKKLSLLKLFLESASPEDYDYVIIDMPPGVTDEHIFLCESAPEAEIVVITTSQNMALDEAAETIETFQSKNMKIIGVVENMRTLKCPNCSSCISMFSKNGAELLAKEYNVPYLGHVDYIPGIETAETIPKEIIKRVKNNQISYK